MASDADETDGGTDTVTPLRDVDIVDKCDEGPSGSASEPSEPDVIPLQALGCCDTDLSNVSTSELMLYALANIENAGDEGGYAVRHGKQAMNQFGQPRKGEVADPHG
ncbi:hypothetical protein JB92DRAFT_3118731 [Gautieria morchelliformis]|nr:hypothetical protein JB92DRAFT_3118731 [Gautieria morchelliformis]